MSKPPLWTRDFILLTLLNFLQVLVFYLLVVVVGLYAINHFNASVSESGLVVGAFIVGVAVGRLAIGQYMERIGHKRSMLVGLCLAIAACLLYFLDVGLVFLVANRLVHGIAVGVAATAGATILAHQLPLSRRGEGIGFFSMGNSLSAALGPAIGIYMNRVTSFEAILVLCCVVSAACLLVGLLLSTQDSKPDIDLERALTGFSFKRLLEPSVVPVCLVIFACGLCFSSILAYLNAFAVERELSQAASLFFICYAITVLVTRPLSGRLLDSHGANTVMYPAFVLFAIGLVLLGRGASGSSMLIAACLIGLGFGNIQSCGQAIAIKLVEPANLGLATSTYFIFLDSGLGFGPYLLGLFIAGLGYSGLYQSLGLLALIAMAGYYLVHGRKQASMI